MAEARILTLTDLPDIVLIHILRNITLHELLENVSKVNKRLNEVINHTSSLWWDFDFDFPLELTEENLLTILTHSVGIKNFRIPYATLNVFSYVLDFQFTTQLPKANLVSLDLSGCRVSTLCFLHQLAGSLKELNVSECDNLVDEDFEAIQTLPLLETLYMSFNQIDPSVIVRVCRPLNKLKTLDVSGIKLSVIHCAAIVTDHLHWFSLSIDSEEDEVWFCGICRNFKDLSVNIYRPLGY